MIGIPVIIRQTLIRSNIRSNTIRQLHKIRIRYFQKWVPYQVFGVIGGTVLAVCTVYKWGLLQSEKALKSKSEEESLFLKLTSWEERFIKFASLQYDGQLYMTPQDFLESIVETESVVKLTSRSLTKNDVDKMLLATSCLPSSARQFRDLQHIGIISYTEYVFLLSMLTKPESCFKIAFSMFDADGDGRIDKAEFVAMGKLLGYVWKGKKRMIGNKEFHLNTLINEDYVDDKQVDTTLTVYFFGLKGNKSLIFKDFHKFMLNLQAEVLELEFNKFSKGLSIISEINFAEMLLRYTYLDVHMYNKYYKRVLDRVKCKGITFEEFLAFSNFLNNMEDFGIVMQIYSLAGHSISKGEFQRAVKVCTDKSLSPHIVDIVFAIFDVDDDGLLNYREFCAIMKNRHNRGLKSTRMIHDWKTFKPCIKNEMTKAL